MYSRKSYNCNHHRTNTQQPSIDDYDEDWKIDNLEATNKGLVINSSYMENLERILDAPPPDYPN